jgi:hypothetical protein
MSKKYDTSDDIKLGKNLHRAMQEERLLNKSSKRTDRLVKYFIIFLIILGLISLGLYLLLGI